MSGSRRQLLFVLPFIVAVGLLFFHKTSNNTSDFGNVPAVAGYGCWEEITDCTGDTNLLTIDAIDWSRSTDGTIAVRTTPSGFTTFTSQPLNGSGSAIGEGDERGKRGFAEKRVGRKWERVGEIEIGFVANVVYDFGYSASPDSLQAYVDKYDDRWTFQELRILLPEYEPGATYRITYFFHYEQEQALSDEVYSVSHTITLPKQTDKRFDFISLGWGSSDGRRFWPEIRVNYGEAPYLLLDACTLEQKENGQWTESLDEDGESAFWVHGDSPTMELSPCRRMPNHYYLPQSYWYVALGRIPYPDYRLTLVFCDNADGSGERYTLTLYLNTELLKEYQ